MPKTNQTDPGISFPRLQAKNLTINGNTYFVTVWLREEEGGNRRRSAMAQQDRLKTPTWLSSSAQSYKALTVTSTLIVKFAQ